MDATPSRSDWTPQTTPLGYRAVTVTIGEALDPNFNRAGIVQTEDTDLYVIRDNKLPIYIGTTERGCMYRLSGHVYGSYGSGPSPVGRYIADNAPESLSWQFDMIDHRDCAAFVERELPPRERFDAATAERALILALAPLLNVTHNATPGYYASDELDLQNAATDKIPLCFTSRRPRLPEEPSE